MKLSKQIALWMKKEVKKAGKKGIILGISGGIDSAVTAAIAKMAVGKNVLGLIMPCGSVKDDIRLARLVANKFGIKKKEIDLGKVYRNFVKLSSGAKKLAKANLKPRLRMVTLYYFANSLDYIVAGTGNKSELNVGYFTKHGDGGVDILPLGNLLKREVRKLAVELDVPKEIIDRPPSAGLWHGQTDESEMGISYEKLDMAIDVIEERKKFPIGKNIILKVRKMMAMSQHKRAGLPIFKAHKGGRGWKR